MTSATSAKFILPTYQEMRASIDRERYAQNPTSWVHERLKGFLWSKQREVFNSVRDHRRTAVHSCHTVGKSHSVARLATWWIETHKPGEAFVVTSAPTAAQVRAVLWREIGRAHTAGKLSGRLNQTEWWMTMPEGNEEMVAFGRKPRDIDPTAFQGIHAPYVLVILDEASGIDKAIWDAADTLLSNTDSKIIAIGNPDDPLTEFAEVCKPGSGWNVIGISAYDTPNFTGEKVPDNVARQLISPLWVEEKKRKWGEDNPIYISKVLGQFPQVSTGGLIPLQWVRAAQLRELVPTGPVELGVDVGGGGDSSTVAIRRGGHVRIVHRSKNPDTMQTLGAVMEIMKTNTDVAKAKVDQVGIGWGAVNRALEVSSDTREGALVREAARKIVGIQVGGAPQDKETFANLRAEGCWGLRERFQDGEIDIDPNDDDLAAQLVNIRYKRTSTGKIQIESKDEMKRRGMSSPDDFDAVMLSFLAEPDEGSYDSATWRSNR